jgi:hypothetical protein
VSPRAGLNVQEKRKIPYSYRESNPNSSVVQPVDLSLYRLSYHACTAFTGEINECKILADRL